MRRKVKLSELYKEIGKHNSNPLDFMYAIMNEAKLTDEEAFINEDYDLYHSSFDDYNLAMEMKIKAKEELRSAENKLKQRYAKF